MYIYLVEKFTIQLSDGSTYMVYARSEKGTAVFVVRIDKYLVTFKGNPDWDTLGNFIEAVNPPADLDADLLEEIANKIDNFDL